MWWAFFVFSCMCVLYCVFVYVLFVFVKKKIQKLHVSFSLSSGCVVMNKLQLFCKNFPEVGML